VLVRTCEMRRVTHIVARVGWFVIPAAKQQHDVGRAVPGSVSSSTRSKGKLGRSESELIQGLPCPNSPLETTPPWLTSHKCLAMSLTGSLLDLP
jgi:hypothetical protein